MKVLVNLYDWESPRFCSSETDLQEGDKVIIKGEFGNSLGTVVMSGMETTEEPEQPILRKATKRDSDVFEKNKEKKKEIIEICRKEVKRLGLEMKLVDVAISLDGSNIVVVFSAEERVDFRELVKNLSRIFHRSVKMHQIGSRDEARKSGGCGVCGRELCCVRFLKSLPSISVEMARLQQIAHRGSERISGQCGRLLCCLSYEARQYQEMLEGLPEIHSQVKTKEGKGEVLELNVIKQEARVKLEDGKIVTVKKKDIK
ncbi:MAG: regulatory iron-sulfur-containing complex subunit RicT [Candidatus Moranbacteria bacterium]|nr:regulatory iron-sulfur-containing complex subunit RicT [Candidatus Moranbacteria bacterium]